MDKEQLEQDLCDTLRALPIPVDIGPHSTCFGKSYWEWSVKDARGIEASFPEAVGQALNSLLTPPRKRSA